MKRPGMPARTKPMPRSGPIRRTARKPAEFRRIYGPDAYAEHVHRSPCLWCGLEGEAIQQAHLVSNHATSKKNDWTTTGPLCGPAARPRNCHDRWDGRAQPAFTSNERAEILRRQKAFLESWMQSTTEPRQASA